MHRAPDLKRLKIGYVMQADAVDMSTPSGPAQHVRHIVRGLERRGNSVRMVAIQENEIRWTDDLQLWRPVEPRARERASFRLVESLVRGMQRRLHAPFFRFFDSIRFSHACVAALSDVDILYERDGTICYGGIIAARRLGIPAVLEVNGDLVEEWCQLGLQMSRLQRITVHWLTGQIYRHASHLVAVGDTLKERLVRRWKIEPSHITVVRNGADVELFGRSQDPATVRGRFGIGAGRVVVFSGGFQPWHGVEMIIEAFSRVASRLPDATMVFVGDGPQRASAEADVKAQGLEKRVVFTGRRSHAEVAQLVGVADVAVIYQRGIAAEIVETPLKLFEYMAAGRAIVAPAMPNMLKLLRDRENALLVAPDSPGALAGAMLELLADEPLRHSLGEAARGQAISQHSWDRAAQAVEAVLYDCLRKQEGRRSRGQEHTVEQDVRGSESAAR